MKGLSECKASESNIRRIRVKDIVKKVKDYFKTYSSAGMDISCDSDVEEDQMTRNEFMVDLNVEYHERALQANQKRFYKRYGRVGSARKPLDKTKETCFACGKLGHFHKDCHAHKTSTPSYPSSNKSFNKSKPYTPSFNQTSSQNSGNHQKDYKGLKAEIVVLTKRIDDMTMGKSEKGKKEKKRVKRAYDEPSVGKAVARSGQWVDITIKKVHRLLSMTDGDEKNQVLDYTYVDLHYVEDQKKNLTCSKVTLDQLLSEQVHGNNVKALGGKGRRKEKISSKEVVFTKADESSYVLAPEITSDSESKSPSGTLENFISLSDLILNTADLTLDTPDPKKTRLSIKVSPTYVIKQIEFPSGTPPSSSQPSSSKASKQKTWFGPCKHRGFRNHVFDDCYSKPKCSTCGSTNHLTKEHLKHVTVKKTLSKLKAQLPLRPSPKRAPMISKPLIQCKYYGFNDHHSNHCEFYPRSEVCCSIAYEASNYLKKHPNFRRPRIANRQSEPTEKNRIRDLNAASASECLYVNFLSEMEPKKLIEALKEEGWIIAKQEELNQFERNKDYNQHEWTDYEETFAPIARMEAIGIFIAYETYMGFMVYQMDVKSPDESGVSVNEMLFKGMIGSLMYLIASRPDIQLSTCLCARYQANPKESHIVAKEYLRRLQILGGKLVCWIAKKQISIVMSSAEADTTTPPDISLSEYEAFYDDHVKEISSGKYDCFLFKVEPNSRDFTKDVVEDISPTKEPQVLNTLPNHSTLQLNMKFQPSSEFLFTYVVPSKPKGISYCCGKKNFQKEYLRRLQILGGKLVCWIAKKQISIAMSSGEAKYVATAGCCDQVHWIKSQPADYDVLYDK
nr:hypothetical protein [Tanacetum cinerariifolium]